MNIEQEQAFMKPFLGRLALGNVVVVVAAVRQALQARLGRPVALASVYNSCCTGIAGARWCRPRCISRLISRRGRNGKNLV